MRLVVVLVCAGTVFGLGMYGTWRILDVGIRWVIGDNS